MLWTKRMQFFKQISFSPISLPWKPLQIPQYFILIYKIGSFYWALIFQLKGTMANNCIANFLCCSHYEKTRIYYTVDIFSKDLFFFGVCTYILYNPKQFKQTYFFLAYVHIYCITPHSFGVCTYILYNPTQFKQTYWVTYFLTC